MLTEVVPTFDPSTQELEADRSLWVLGQPRTLWWDPVLELIVMQVTLATGIQLLCHKLVALKMEFPIVATGPFPGNVLETQTWGAYRTCRSESGPKVRDVYDEASQLHSNSREFCESCLGYICSSVQSLPVHFWWPPSPPSQLLHSLSLSLPLFSAVSFSLSCRSSIYLCFYSLISPR